MRITLLLAGFGLLVNLLAWVGLARESVAVEGAPTLLNASYDPTRELWRELNTAFKPAYAAETGRRINIRQSHGGSGAQARAVIDGLPADVVTLALWSDTDAIRKAGLIANGWENRLPNRSLPYCSTIVFVVRRGNPKGIHDWPDLIRPGIQIITPNPKMSGNGKLSFLAAWGAVKTHGGSDAEAEAFVAQLYREFPADTSARGATTRFVQHGFGDVHLTWENEAHLEVRESRGALSIVYPPVSIRAEPFVAVVDAVVDRKGSRRVAEDYLRFLYKKTAQEIIARNYYRPVDEDVAAKYRDLLPPISLFSVTAVAADWADAQRRYFADGGVFDRINDTASSKRR